MNFKQTFKLCKKSKTYASRESGAFRKKRFERINWVKHHFIRGRHGVGYVTCGCGSKQRLDVHKPGDKIERGLHELLIIGQAVIVLTCQLVSVVS